MTFRIKLTRTISLFIALLLIALGAVAQEVETKKSFQGTVEVQFRNSDRVQILTYSVKNGKIRVEERDREDNSPIILVDHGMKRTYIILPAREEYIEVSNEQESSALKQSKVKADIQKTDATDEILNYPCDQFVVKLVDKEIEVWATKDLGTPGTFLNSVTTQSLDSAPWQRDVLGMGYFPLRVTERDSAGNELTQSEAVSVQKKALAESLFRVPPAYEKVGPDALQPKQAPKKKRTR